MEAPFSLETLLDRYRNRRPQIQEIYRQMYVEAGRLVKPGHLRRTFPAGALPDLADCLPGAESLHLGVCTLGPALEERVSALFSEDPAAAVVLDEIGSLWVNGLGREMHQAIRTEAWTAGKQASPSYRPGIGRWPVELQEKILSHLPTADLGVRLSSGILVPQRTISMIVAVGARLGRNCYAPGGKRDPIRKPN